MRHSYVASMRWMVIYEYEITGGKIPMAEPGIEPGTS
jgi:hypothetical protein